MCGEWQAIIKGLTRFGSLNGSTVRLVKGPFGPGNRWFIESLEDKKKASILERFLDTVIIEPEPEEDCFPCDKHGLGGRVVYRSVRTYAVGLYKTPETTVVNGRGGRRGGRPGRVIPVRRHPLPCADGELVSTKTYGLGLYSHPEASTTRGRPCSAPARGGRGRAAIATYNPCTVSKQTAWE